VKKMAWHDKKIRVYLEVEDQDTGDIVDDEEGVVWGSPGHVLRVYINGKVVYKHIVEEEE